MSVSVVINNQHAVLADGEWRSANAELRDLLNSHLATAQLEVGAHLPPGDRELQLARLACAQFDGKIVDARGADNAPPRTPDGNLTVF
jgi:hypothetical protein